MGHFKRTQMQLEENSMKTQTKTLTVAPTVSILAMALLVVAGSLLAGPARDPVTGTGSSSAINPYQFAGSATLVIRGQVKPAALLVTLLGLTVSDEGVQHVEEGVHVGQVPCDHHVPIEVCNVEFREQLLDVVDDRVDVPRHLVHSHSWLHLWKLKPAVPSKLISGNKSSQICM